MQSGFRKPRSPCQEAAKPALSMNHLPEEKYMFMERWAWVCSSPQAISQSLYLVTVPKRELTAILKKKKKKAFYRTFRLCKTRTRLWTVVLLPAPALSAELAPSKGLRSPGHIYAEGLSPLHPQAGATERNHVRREGWPEAVIFGAAVSFFGAF